MLFLTPSHMYTCMHACMHKHTRKHPYTHAHACAHTHNTIFFSLQGLRSGQLLRQFDVRSSPLQLLIYVIYTYFTIHYNGVLSVAIVSPPTWDGYF